MQNTKSDIFQKFIWLAVAAIIIVFAYQYLIIFFGAFIFANFVSHLVERLPLGNKLPNWAAKSILWTLLLLLFGVFVVLFGNQLADNFNSFFVAIRDALSSFVEQVKGSQFVSSDMLEGSASLDLLKNFAGPLSSVFQLVVLLLLLVLLAVFMSFELSLLKVYLKRFVDKFANSPKDFLKKLEDTSDLMFTWLKDRLLSMFTVSVLIFLSLLAVDIDYKLPLAILAGLLSFVPNLGPVLALIPALLLSLPQGLETMLIVLGVYLAVQFLESYLITPFIFKSDLKLPISMTFLFQFVFGALFGVVGLLFAVPMGLFIASMMGVYEKYGI